MINNIIKDLNNLCEQLHRQAENEMKKPQGLPRMAIYQEIANDIERIIKHYPKEDLTKLEVFAKDLFEESKISYNDITAFEEIIRLYKLHKE